MIFKTPALIATHHYEINASNIILCFGLHSKVLMLIYIGEVPTYLPKQNALTFISLLCSIILIEHDILHFMYFIYIII